MDGMKPMIETYYRNRIEDMENNILKAVADVGIVVNKERLEKALYDAHSFYHEGYAAAEKRFWRHGRWVNERMLVGGFAEKWGCDCSCCGRTIEEPLWKPDYCPNCGARMDKENDNDKD